MYMHQPSFKMGGPACNLNQESLNETECKQAANAQNMPFYKWKETSAWPSGCFQYQKVDGDPALAHNPAQKTAWPNSGNEATQYCK